MHASMRIEVGGSDIFTLPSWGGGGTPSLHFIPQLRDDNLPIFSVFSLLTPPPLTFFLYPQIQIPRNNPGWGRVGVSAPSMQMLRGCTYLGSVHNFTVANILIN